jgi:hypothetical protein
VVSRTAAWPEVIGINVSNAKVAITSPDGIVRMLGDLTGDSPEVDTKTLLLLRAELMNLDKAVRRPVTVTISGAADMTWVLIEWIVQVLVDSTTGLEPVVLTLMGGSEAAVVDLSEILNGAGPKAGTFLRVRLGRDPLGATTVGAMNLRLLKVTRTRTGQGELREDVVAYNAGDSMDAAAFSGLNMSAVFAAAPTERRSCQIELPPPLSRLARFSEVVDILARMKRFGCGQIGLVGALTPLPRGVLK